MSPRRRRSSAARWLGTGLGLAAASYGTYAALTWLRYGHVAEPTDDEADAALDRFMPEYEVVERHHIGVTAPAAVTLAAAREQDLFRYAPVRAILRARELILGATSSGYDLPRTLMEQALAIGWG